MSDFDKEAEREKLREKYERDKQKREATEQMSELLLKGATMTNTHCGTCGDPIFRYDGQEFCPTCEEVVTDPEDAPEGGDTTEPADTGGDDADSSATEPTADATAATPDADTNGTADQPATGQAAAEHTSTDAGEPHTAADRAAPETEGQTREAAPTAAGTGPAREVPSTDPDATAPRVSTAPETVAGDDPSLASARASLARTVTQLAREAEQSGDLERVRAYLAATEEAADALDAVKRADR
jgi:uncharacterized Zn finger protein (UPF0148 family)